MTWAWAAASPHRLAGRNPSIANTISCSFLPKWGDCFRGRESLWGLRPTLWAHLPHLVGAHERKRKRVKLRSWMRLHFWEHTVEKIGGGFCHGDRLDIDQSICGDFIVLLVVARRNVTVHGLGIIPLVHGRLHTRVR